MYLHIEQEFARKLQHKEKVRYELRKKEKELRRQRKLLECELQRESAELADGKCFNPCSLCSLLTFLHY